MHALIVLFMFLVFGSLYVLVVLYLVRGLQNRTRIAATAEELPMKLHARDVASRTRRTGIVLLSAGVGILLMAGLLAILFGPSSHSNLGALKVWFGLALIPISIGAGFLIDYRFQLRDLSREEKARD